MTTSSYDADVLVLGAGPAGVAAAVMAASLGLEVLVVEAGSVGGKLQIIDALNNVPGGWSTGPQLANSLGEDLARLQRAGRCLVMQARGAAVAGRNDRAELTLDDGQVLTAQTIVVATGVAPVTPHDADWVTAPSGFSAAPLWRTSPTELTPRTYVLGADRPLGTWLRAHPDASTTLHVLCPQADDYKAAEVAGDQRVRLVPASRVVVSQPAYGSGWNVDVEGRDGKRTPYVATTVLNNLGSKPAALAGLVTEADGYCPPERQHPRIRIAGDLRSARYQRIAAAQGSGAEAALSYYYATALREAI